MVKSFFIFAAVRRQAGEDRAGGAVRPATACAACGVHAAGHWNGCTGAILRLRRLRRSSPKPTPPWFLRTAVFCKCTFKKFWLTLFRLSGIIYLVLPLVTSEDLRILVYNFTIFVRLHNFFTVVLCMSHKGRGFSITPCNFCKSVNHWQGINKVQSCMAIPFRIEIP